MIHTHVNTHTHTYIPCHGCYLLADAVIGLTAVLQHSPSTDALAGALSGTFSGSPKSTSADSCLQCNTNEFSGANASSCTACPVNAVDVNKLTCQCPPGYKRVDGAAAGEYTCVECPAGTYAPDANANVCRDCPAGVLFWALLYLGTQQMPSTYDSTASVCAYTWGGGEC